MTVITDVAGTTPDARPGCIRSRHRLLDGLASSIAEAHIVRHARTSKRTFYQEFSSKEDCFIELLWSTNQDMITQIRSAVDPEADWDEQVKQAVNAYVHSIESRPAEIWLSWIRELPALGSAVRSLRRRLAHELGPDARGPHRASPFRGHYAVILVGVLRELTALTVEDDMCGISRHRGRRVYALPHAGCRARPMLNCLRNNSLRCVSRTAKVRGNSFPSHPDSTAGFRINSDSS